ncbi:MAG TPA: hypothetical protein VF898_05255 [Chloroflexota bacterium]
MTFSSMTPLLLSHPTEALAADARNGTTGQSVQDCSQQTSAPSGFGSEGFNRAESQDANRWSTGGIAPGSSYVVTQDDVACFNVSPH